MSKNAAMDLMKYVAEYGRRFGHSVPMFEMQHSETEELLEQIKAALESGQPVAGWEGERTSSIVNEEPAASQLQSGDPVLDWMKAHNIPLTRENYLRLNQPDRPDEPLTGEEQMALPPMFRRPASNAALELMKYAGEYARLFGHPVPMETQHNSLEENLAIVKKAVESKTPVPGWDKLPSSSIVQETAPRSMDSDDETMAFFRHQKAATLRGTPRLAAQTPPPAGAPSSSPKETMIGTPRQELEKSLERAKKVYGENHPYTKSLQTQLDGMKAADGRSAQEIYFSGRPMSSTKKG